MALVLTLFFIGALVLAGSFLRGTTHDQEDL